MDKITIIVPIYNVRKYLNECIDSILRQSYSNFELVLVDDGSDDGCAEICDEYSNIDSRIRCFHKENGGLTSARNYGLSKATGDWIMHVDGDDWIESNMLSTMITTATDNSADVVIGDLRQVSPESTSILRSVDWNDDKIESLNKYIGSVWTCLCGSMSKKSLYDTYCLQSPQGIAYCEDFHLMVRLCWYAEKVVHVPVPFYNYRQQQASIVHNMNPKTEKDEQWVCQDIIKFFSQQGALENYSRVLNWRVLKSTQEMLLDSSRHNEFGILCKASTKDIFSCPFINNKLKLMAWMIKHNLKSLVVVILHVRRWLGR